MPAEEEAAQTMVVAYLSRIESARNLLHNLAARPFISTINPERKTLARSFYIDSSQNYPQARRGVMERWETIFIERKPFPSNPPNRAFGIPTAFNKTTPFPDPPLEASFS